MGPHTYNFADAAALAQREGAAMRVADIDVAVRVAMEMLVPSTQDQRNAATAPEAAYPSADRALAFAGRHRGAAKRMAQQIVGLNASADPSV